MVKGIPIIIHLDTKLVDCCLICLNHGVEKTCSKSNNPLSATKIRREDKRKNFVTNLYATECYLEKIHNHHLYNLNFYIGREPWLKSKDRVGGFGRPSLLLEQVINTSFDILPNQLVPKSDPRWLQTREGSVEIWYKATTTIRQVRANPSRK